MGMQIRWLVSWAGIHQNHERLKDYEESMWDLIELYEKAETTRRPKTISSSVVSEEPVDFGLFDSKEAAEQMLSTTMQNMSVVPSTEIQDPFITNFISLHSTLQCTPPPPLSLIAQNSLTQNIDIQARLTQHALLSLFFNTLKLRDHLSILHRYLLFGNGVFVTRLQEALFDDFDEDDVRSGGQRGLGLGIGVVKDNQTWPPNGGKVTVVLRNVLSECLSETEQSEVSFAYRELSEERFERIKNPISTGFPRDNVTDLGLEALDFIQLLYKPPFPLDAIITSSVLEKYDCIFLFLLRLFRMQYIAQQLFRDAASRTSYAQGLDPLSQRFRIEAHHFITTITGYIFHVSIGTQWHHFQRQLDEIQRSLHTRNAGTSVTELRELHLQTLDRMMFACFLKRRQGAVLSLLYACFEPVLLFAKTSRMYARREQRVWARMREEMADNTRILYTQFSKKAGMFVRVIDQLESRGVGKAGETMREGLDSGWFADLLVRLDWSYFDR